MEQYIKKSTLLTEIKRRIKTNKECMLGLRNLDYYQGKVDALNDTLSSLDTIGGKEVDLKKEAELIANGIMIGVQANKYNTVVYNTKRNDFNHSHLMLAARKGIELGIKASILSQQPTEVQQRKSSST